MYVYVKLTLIEIMCDASKTFFGMHVLLNSLLRLSVSTASTESILFVRWFLQRARRHETSIFFDEKHRK